MVAAIIAHANAAAFSQAWEQDLAVAEATLRRTQGLAREDLAGLGLTSQDLVELGVRDVRQRIALLHSWDNSGDGRRKAENDALRKRRELPTPTQEFSFAVSHFNSSRQWGKCLNIIVKYRYMPADKAMSFDYRPIQQLTVKLAQPTASLPMNSEWEDINMELVSQVFTRFNVTAVSSQIQVMQEINNKIWEPGNHGSLITMGDIPAIPEPLANAFSYDCTKYNGTGRFAG